MSSWADQFNTYEEACIFHGADTPAQLRAEAEYERQEACVQIQDELEAGGPEGRRMEIASWCAAMGLDPHGDAIPF